MAFEHVVTEAIVLGKVRKDFAWQIIKDYKRYPNMMENVDGVEIHFQGDTAGKSEWFVSIEGAPLRWVEKELFDKEAYIIRFESIDGDFDNINGIWKIDDYEGKGIKIYFRLDYNLGIPVIEEVLGHILKEKMQTNADMMIKAIKKELENYDVEERRYERFAVNSLCNLMYNDKALRVFVANVSRGGMQFFYDGRLDELCPDFRLGRFNIKTDLLYNDPKQQHIRLVFKNTLEEEELKTLIADLKAGETREDPRSSSDKKIKIGLDGEYLHKLDCT